MVDPITLIGLIAAFAQLVQMGGQGVNLLTDLFPEYGRFWERFEQLLRDEEGLSWDDLEAECYRNPDFHALAVAYIGADEEAQDRLRDHFASFVPDDLLPTVLRAAETAASEAVTDDRKAALADRRFILQAVEGARVSLAEQLSTVGDAVSVVDEKVERGNVESAAAHERLQASPDDITEVVNSGQLSPQQLAAIQERIDERMLDDPGRRAVSQEQVAALLEQQRRELSQDFSEQLAEGLQRLADERQRSPEVSAAPVLGATARGALELDQAGTLAEHVEKLRAEDAEGAIRIDALLAQGGAALLVAEARASRFDDGTAVFHRAVGRILLASGFALEAEQAFLRAVEASGTDDEQARQWVRAAAAANAQDEGDRFRDYLDRARKLFPGLPSLAITEARASSDASYMLTRLEGVEGETDGDRALIHQTRGQAQLSLGDEEAAGVELALAQAADATNISVREFEAILPWYSATLRISRGQAVDRASLVEAGERFANLADEVERLGRSDEAAQVWARAAESFALAEDMDRALGVLHGVRHPTSLKIAAKVALARAALVCHRADLAVGFIPSSAQDDEARLVRAEATVMGNSSEDRRAAVRELERLFQSTDAATRHQAAFALLAASSYDLEVAWNEEAATVIRDFKAETEAAMRAERLYREDKVPEAEALLLPYAHRTNILRRLRDYSAQQGHWAKVEDRSMALLRLDSDPRDRLLLAEAKRQLDRAAEASTDFLSLARDPEVPDDVHEQAFTGAIEAVGASRDYEAIRDLASEWLEALPTSANGRWNLAFAWARLSEHRQAYELLKDEPLADLNEQRATLLAEIALRGAPAEDAVRRIIALSDHFERKVEALEALTMAASQRAAKEDVSLDAALGERVTDTYLNFQARFPESTTVRQITAPTPEAFFNAVRELQGDRPAKQREASEAIMHGTLPVTALVAVSSGGIGATWAKLRALPLGFAIGELDALEVETAKQALGGAAVWDSSALFVAGLLGDDVRGKCSVGLPGSMISHETLEDADSDKAFGGLGTGETLHDPDGHVQVREVSDEERDAEQQRIDQTLAFAKGFRIQAADGAGASDDASRLYEESKEIQSEMQPLAADLLLAQRTGRPLYSDDRWIRQAARALGVPAFGTLALLSAAQTSSIISADELRAARLTLARRGGWGVRLSRAELIAHARASQFSLSNEDTAVLNDRAAWRAQPGDQLRECFGLLELVFEEQNAIYPEWVKCALDAFHRSVLPLSKAWAAQAMTVFAWGIAEETPDLSNKAFQSLIDVMKDTPRGLAGHPVVGAMDQLLSYFADEQPWIRIRVLFIVLGRLRMLDQYGALRLFTELPLPPLEGWRSPYAGTEYRIERFGKYLEDR